MRLILMFAAAAVLAGCASIKTKTVGLQKGAVLVSHSGPVCMLAGALPDGVGFTQVGRIRSTKRTYGERENLMLPMADEARRVGADAIINLQTDIHFKGPIPWRVMAPNGDGLAVKMAETVPAFDCAGNGGRLL